MQPDFSFINNKLRYNPTDVVVLRYFGDLPTPVDDKLTLVAPADVKADVAAQLGVDTVEVRSFGAVLFVRAPNVASLCGQRTADDRSFATPHRIAISRADALPLTNEPLKAIEACLNGPRRIAHISRMLGERAVIVTLVDKRSATRAIGTLFGGIPDHYPAPLTLDGVQLLVHCNWTPYDAPLATPPPSVAPAVAPAIAPAVAPAAPTTPVAPAASIVQLSPQPAPASPETLASIHKLFLDHFSKLRWQSQPVVAPTPAPWSAPPGLSVPAPVPAVAADDFDLFCPITHDIMSDPVVAADGHSYERSAIEEWFSTKPVPISPSTNKPLESTALLPNRTLLKIIKARTGK